MIKYLGSKRRLLPALEAIAAIVRPSSAVDVFTGTTRVAQGLRRQGATVTAVDTARYSYAFAKTYIEAEPDPSTIAALDLALADIARAPAIDGYVTQVFSSEARYFHPDNGRRIDGFRRAIRDNYSGTPLEPLLLTALVEAADRVDSTTGLQMAYLKAWAPRALRPIELRRPELVVGPAGTALRGDAVELLAGLGSFDLAYLDPPYNQHRYDANYHVWETLIADDAPEHYGVACKRIDLRDAKSSFNDRSRIGESLGRCIEQLDSRVILLSYSNEGWLSLGELQELCRRRGSVSTLAFDSKRYVGAQIGIHSPEGKKVGEVSHLRNVEYLLVVGDLTDHQRRRIRAVAHARPTAPS